MYVTYTFSKYTWVVYLKEKRGMAISNAFFKKQMNPNARIKVANFIIDQLSYGYKTII